MNLIRVKFLPLILILSIATSFSVLAQGTFSQIKQMMQTKCSGSGCHSGSSPSFNVNDTDADLYADLINNTPANPAAAAKGNKLVKPGYVTKSFLLRKIAHGISEPLELGAQEGADMPSGSAALADNEIELVRQWILFGAPMTGDVVDTAMINTYYREGGIDDTYPTHPVPAAGTGFQMYVGRIFIAPHTETYYYIKQDPGLTTNIEIPRVETFLPAESHHFVMFKFFPGQSGFYREGIRDSSEGSHANVMDGIGTGPNHWEYNLPPGTAYFWEQGTMLDLNLHLRNTSDSIRSCDLYMNIYTQPIGTAEHFMLIKNFPNFDISIPQDGQPHTFTVVANDTNETKYWKIWQLYSHTHRYGIDYDIYLRNENGTKGNQEYEGWYSYEDDFMVGFYRNDVDATIRHYPDNDFLVVDPRLGFIHEATWINTDGPDPVLWGNTSSEEMMVMGFQYIQGDDLTSIKSQKKDNYNINIYPNPTLNEFNVNLTLKNAADVKMELFDMVGESIDVIMDEQAQAGVINKTITTSSYQLTNGIYYVRTTINGNATTSKVILMN